MGTVGIALGCLVLWHQALHMGVFDDAFWHRASGVWMLDHHQVIRRDVFSYTVFGHSWRSPEWGYDVLLAESVRIFGPTAFWFLSAGVGSLAVLAVAGRSRVAGAGWTWTGLLCVETGVAITPFLDDRPQVVSYLLFAGLLLLLSLARRNRKWLWAVPILFALWANLHGSFVLGLGVLVLELAAAWLPHRIGRISAENRLSAKATLVTLVVSAIATLLNPFGPSVYQIALSVTFNSTIRRLISEWQSPDFHDLVMLAVVAIPLALTVGYLALSKAPLPAAELVLAAALLLMALQAARFLPYFAIAWCALAASCSPIPREQLRPSVLVWPMLIVLGVGFLQGPWYPAGTPASSVPVRAVNYLEAHPGRVFSSYLWNDYLDWLHIPVFVDGRTELYTNTPVFNEYLAVDGMTTDPDPVLRDYKVKYVLWPPATPLGIFLAHDPSWQRVWSSHTAVIFRSTG